MAAAVTLLAKERRGPKIAFQALFYPVTDANFDTQSYNTLQEGYWLTREGMKWFWNNYAPDNTTRKEPTASPLRLGLVLPKMIATLSMLLFLYFMFLLKLLRAHDKIV